jgi:hypothetical protein
MTRRPATVTLPCPADECEGTITVTLSPYLRGTHLDPPEYPEIEEVRGACGHNAEWEAQHEALIEQAEARLAEEEEA